MFFRKVLRRLSRFLVRVGDRLIRTGAFGTPAC
jgi:hypothetical protein